MWERLGFVLRGARLLGWYLYAPFVHPVSFYYDRCTSSHRDNLAFVQTIAAVLGASMVVIMWAFGLEQEKVWEGSVLGNGIFTAPLIGDLALSLALMVSFGVAACYAGCIELLGLALFGERRVSYKAYLQFRLLSFPSSALAFYVVFLALGLAGALATAIVGAPSSQATNLMGVVAILFGFLAFVTPGFRVVTAVCGSRWAAVPLVGMYGFLATLFWSA